MNALPINNNSENLNVDFEDGFKAITVNHDPARVIYINPSDYGIIERFRKYADDVRKKAAGYDDINVKADGTIADEEDMEKALKAADRLAELDKYIRAQIDEVFNSAVSDTIFGKQSCLSTIGGIPLYERVFNALMPVIENAIQAEVDESEKRIKKYNKAAVKYRLK